jgi:hypothetical protein
LLPIGCSGDVTRRVAAIVIRGVSPFVDVR